ncbi:transcription-associated protein 1 [Marasmius crinis-equi]|uniref:Transcription-associated protein 1 n=1 Tax=Marasmius crinis-equi TaxID=585013 RepID=A0ABR3FJN0_9AGAR
MFGCADDARCIVTPKSPLLSSRMGPDPPLSHLLSRGKSRSSVPDASRSDLNLSGVLARKKESRKRNLFFHIPATVSCCPNFHQYKSDSPYISFSDILDLHCQQAGDSREDPVLVSVEKVRKVRRESCQTNGRTLSKVDYLTLKKAHNDEVVADHGPELQRVVVADKIGQYDIHR